MRGQWVAVYNRGRYQVANILTKGLKVLQKEHIFYFFPASAEFWTHLSENTAPLLPNILNYLIFNNNNRGQSRGQLGSSWGQLWGSWRALEMDCYPIYCLDLVGYVLGSSVAVQKIAYKQVLEASDSSLSGSLCLYNEIKNILLLVKFSLFFSVNYDRGLRQNSSEFLYSNVLRGSENRRKLTELQTEKRVICYQKCVQWGLSHWIISRLQQIRYLVSCLPPYKTSVWFGQFYPLLLPINWRKIQGVFLKFGSVGCLRFRYLDFQKRRGGSMLNQLSLLEGLKESSVRAYRGAGDA